MSLIDLNGDRECYLVKPQLAPQLPGEYVPVRLYTVLNRQGALRVWPVRLPGPDGKTNAWWDSAHVAAEEAMQGWVRLRPDFDLGAYAVFQATGIATEPSWPELSFREILSIAFKGRFIDNADHVVVRKLRGLE